MVRLGIKLILLYVFLYHITCTIKHCTFKIPHSSVGKETACYAGDPSLIPESGRSPGEGKGYPLQYSGLENSMDKELHLICTSTFTLSLLKFWPVLGS